MVNAFIAQWCPPALRRLINRLLRAQTRYRGLFPDWNAAAAATGGYDEGAILPRVADATCRVLHGEPGYEQDGNLQPGVAPPSHASLFLAGRHTLHPGRSFVANIGNDESGTHAAATDLHRSDVAERYAGALPDRVQQDADAARALSSFLDRQALRNVPLPDAIARPLLREYAVATARHAARRLERAA